MDKTALMAISPLDGRYHEKVNGLRDIFSEFGLIRFRTFVEISWIRFLSEHNILPELITLSAPAKKQLETLLANFSKEDAERVKAIEAEINHDVKAVEYFIKEKFSSHQELAELSEFTHFGCTSEDINNLAYGLMLQTAIPKIILPMLETLSQQLKAFSHNHASLSMLAHTHGQPATPTTLGKEFANFLARLQRQTDQLRELPLLGKLNGATGNYNAFKVTYPDIDWPSVSQNFITQLGLVPNPYTTQIEPHDTISELSAIMIRINTILIDFSRDIWGYIAINYIKQRHSSNEVGSSTMPHKVNPIDFENAEGNLGIANSIFMHMISKLPISRFQRDLSDSTVLRNLGVALGHSLIAYQSASKGVEKLEPNQEAIEADLNQHWEVLAEPIQTVMRRYKHKQPYEQLKKLTRGKSVDKASIHAFINSLDLPGDIKQTLLELTPQRYIGYADELAKKI